ncbi:MAG: rhodanese-like domain-containing protein [Sandaracinus sp.]
MIEASRVLVVGICLGVGYGIVGGVPDVGDFRVAATCTPPVELHPEIGWIEQNDARALVDDTEVVFVDARSLTDYEAGHIPNAIAMPMDTGAIEASTAALALGARTVVAYCDTNDDCASSRRLASLLAEDGARDVRVLRGGIPEWLSNDFPAESGPCRVCP